MKGTSVANLAGDGGERPTQLQGGEATSANIMQAELAIEVLAPPCEYPYFIVACYHGRWAIRPGEYKDPNIAAVKNAVAHLERKGWSHIKICKIPL